MIMNADPNVVQFAFKYFNFSLIIFKQNMQ